MGSEMCIRDRSTLIFAAVPDYLVFGDAPDAAGFAGALIIVAGAVFLALREQALARQKLSKPN